MAEEAPAEEAAEGEEPADTDAGEAETPAEAPAAAEPAQEAPAEGEGEPPKAAAPEIPEEALKAAAEKFAADQVKAANRTMAAARRAQAQVEAVKAENDQLKVRIGHTETFVRSFRSDPMGAIKQLAQFGIGDGTVRGFIDHCIETGTVTDDKPKAAPEKSEVQKLRDELAAEKQAAQDERDRGAVRAAIEKDTARYDLAASDKGQALLWDSIVAYRAEHGQCPDEAVFMLADEVEKHLEQDITSIKSRKFTVQRQDATKPGATAAAPAASAARTGGSKTLSNKATGGVPGSREYSMDPEVRRKQVTEDMRAAGELS